MATSLSEQTLCFSSEVLSPPISPTQEQKRANSFVLHEHYRFVEYAAKTCQTTAQSSDVIGQKVFTQIQDDSFQTKEKGHHLKCFHQCLAHLNRQENGPEQLSPIRQSPPISPKMSKSLRSCRSVSDLPFLSYQHNSKSCVGIVHEDLCEKAALITRRHSLPEKVIDQQLRKVRSSSPEMSLEEIEQLVQKTQLSIEECEQCLSSETKNKHADLTPERREETISPPKLDSPQMCVPIKYTTKECQEVVETSTLIASKVLIFSSAQAVDKQVRKTRAPSLEMSIEEVERLVKETQLSIEECEHCLSSETENKQTKLIAKKQQEVVNLPKLDSFQTYTPIKYMTKESRKRIEVWKADTSSDMAEKKRCTPLETTYPSYRNTVGHWIGKRDISSSAGGAVKSNREELQESAALFDSLGSAPQVIEERTSGTCCKRDFSFRHPPVQLDEKDMKITTLKKDLLARAFRMESLAQTNSFGSVALKKGAQLIRAMDKIVLLDFSNQKLEKLLADVQRWCQDLDILIEKVYKKMKLKSDHCKVWNCRLAEETFDMVEILIEQRRSLLAAQALVVGRGTYSAARTTSVFCAVPSKVKI